MQHVDSNNNSSDYEAIFQDDFTDIDSSSDIEEIMNSDSDEENKLLYLTKMRYSETKASITMEICGINSSIAELIDFICAAQMAKATDALLMVEDRNSLCNDSNYKQRGNLGYDLWKRKKQRKLEKKLLNEDDHVHFSNPMIGFEVLTEPGQITQRTLPEDNIGFPYFYYENVALAPVNVWTGISQYLFDVEPDFVDSKHFHAATLKRGYIYNLPIENRFPLILFSPRTIHDAFPLKKWWPSWDPRIRLNYLQTCTGSVKLTKRIRKALEAYDESHSSVQKYVLDDCRKWNLVCVGRNKVVPHEPDEVDMLLGFPKNHTRGGGFAKDMFPGGINVLSFFSGISDAYVTFYCLGISLKCSRNECDRLEQLMSRFNGLDLVVGGIQCNNLTGRNKHHQDELEDFCWCIFLQ
ncbi:DNA (Cytosine-5)-methyltransferase DRM1/2 isoform 2 [Hibiscus syriacus]|uniref:DNA (Cytosine-5)-methyltransferase DRM1/2 isoform 2 n=1 Tax=Hibiscus syriacus TaxID=106335 RepID=A0A6A2WUT1_HIBSY|nr:DNA (Cytosine-5)-methyltransferase DRM1/2 isoform 2 [Hibiscus syriacus]